jgi:hypothetical protein
MVGDLGMTVELPDGEVLVARHLNALYGLASSQPMFAPETAPQAAADEASNDEVHHSLLITLGPRACSGGWAEIFHRIGLPEDPSVLAHTCRIQMSSPVLVDRQYRVRGRVKPSTVTLGKRAQSYNAFDVDFEFWPEDKRDSSDASAVVTMTMVTPSQLELGGP